MPIHKNMLNTAMNGKPWLQVHKMAVSAVKVAQISPMLPAPTDRMQGHKLGDFSQ